jgi:plastocyanin
VILALMGRAEATRTLAAHAGLPAPSSTAGTRGDRPRNRTEEVTYESPKKRKDTLQMKNRNKCLFGTLLLAGAIDVLAQTNPSREESSQEHAAHFAQIVALDECDPTTFNAPAAAGPGFCKNVTLGAFTTLSSLIAKAAAGTPDPGWDFEPDTIRIEEGTILSVVNQGGEPHTFTEVAKFGGGFIPALNAPGEETAPECSGGFSKVKVAKTRILQGSSAELTDLKEGEHLFQCCIHPLMRVKVKVK